MVDLSTNLFNALPIRPVTRAPASLSLAKQDETNSGGNSLKTALTQSNSIGPKTPTESGFSSLAPVLASLRPPPFELEQINSLDDEPTFFDKLLEQQEGIVLARQKYEARSEQVIKDRERDAAELIENEERARQIRSTILFEPKPELAAIASRNENTQITDIPTGREILQSQQATVQALGSEKAEEEEVEAPPLIGQGENTTAEEAISSEKPQVEPVPFKLFPDPTKVDDAPKLPKSNQPDIEALFSTYKAPEISGQNVNAFV